MRKIAMLKNTYMVNFDSESVILGEFLEIAKLLSIHNDVSILTRKSKRLPCNCCKRGNIEIKDIEIEKYNINNYDAVIFVNSQNNFFGGVDDGIVINNYYCLSHFTNGNIYYILCDNKMFFKDLNLAYKGPYKRNPKKYDLADYDLKNKEINYITQNKDLNGIEIQAKRSYNNIGTVDYFPFEKFPIYTYREKKLNYEFNEHPTFDLVYGGTFRSGSRKNDMLKYFFDYDDKFNIMVFGMTEDQFKNDIYNRAPIFQEPVPYSEYCAKLNNDALATISISDPSFSKYRSLTQRSYLSILSKCVVFIDEKYDRFKELFINEELKNFNYVNNRLDIQDKLNKLKNDIGFRQHIVDLQYRDIMNNSCSNEEYAKWLNKLIK